MSQFPAKILSTALIFTFLSFEVYAQWTRQSPLPTGNELTDVCFINPDTGWIFGDRGTVFSTNDGGQSWTDRSVPSMGRINAGLFMDNETGWVALSAGLAGSAGEIYATPDGGNHWELIFSDNASEIRDLSFLNPDTGWALGYYQQVYPVALSWNFFLKTENGGKDWLVLDFLEESHFTKMVFIDDTTGYIAGAGTPNLMKTIDGGNHWNSVHQPTNAGLTDVVFTDLNNGYTCGNNFYFTHNGGESWGYTSCYYANSIGMYDAYNGWTVTMNKVFSVREGGSLLDYLFTADKSPLIGISAVDSSTAYIIGKEVSIYSTRDGGGSWQELSQGTDKSLYSIFFLNENEGWAGGANHSLLHTFDGGKHWIFNSLSASSKAITDIRFNNADTGWFVNEDVYLTKDGGATWNQASGISNPVNDLYFIDNQTGWCVGIEGKLFKSIDGGQNWEEKSTGTVKDLFAVHFLNVDNGWIAGDGIVERTNNGGESWEVRYTGTAVFSGIQFPDELTGYFMAGDLYLKTGSGGESWDIITPEGVSLENPMKDMFFINDQTGYLSGNDFLMKTTDGGQNWALIPGFPEMQANAIFFVNEHKGWIVGDEGAIFFTETGGAESADEENNSPKAVQFTIFPNPAKEMLNVECSMLNSGGDCSIKIYDLFGREVLAKNAPFPDLGEGRGGGCQGREGGINVSELPPGIYVAVLKNGLTVLGSRKFVICR